MRRVILDNSQTRPQVEAIDAVDRANIGSWFEGVIDEMSKLPWDRPNWSSEDPRPLSIAAVAELMLILLEMVPEYGTPPQMSPTWSGGVMAVWELVVRNLCNDGLIGTGSLTGHTGLYGDYRRAIWHSTPVISRMLVY